MQRRSYLAGVTAGISAALSGCSDLIGVEDQLRDLSEVDSVTHGGLTVGVVGYEVTKEWYVRLHQSVCLETSEVLDDPNMSYLRVICHVETDGSDLSPHDVTPERFVCDENEVEVSAFASRSEGFVVGSYIPDDSTSGDCLLELSWSGNSSDEQTYEFEMVNEFDKQRTAEECGEKQLFAVSLANDEGEERELFNSNEQNTWLSGIRVPQNGEYPISVKVSTVDSSVEERLREMGAVQSPQEFTLLLTLDDEVVERNNFDPELAEAIEQGEWDGEFQLVFQDEETADKVVYSFGGHREV